MDFKTDQSVKFLFDGKEPKNGFVKFRICTDEALLAIHEKTRDKNVSLEPMFKRGPLQRIEHTEVNEELESEKIWDFCIVEWDGVILDGVKIDCTIENKIIMMRKCPDFAAFYAKSLTKINKNYMESFGGLSEQEN